MRSFVGTPAVRHACNVGDARETHTWPPGPDATARMLDFLLGNTGDRPR